MRRLVAAGLVLASICILGLEAVSAGDKDKDKKGEKKSGKILTVGSDGLKIDAKITDEDMTREYTFDLGGKVGNAKFQGKVYSVKLEAGKKYTMTMDTDDKTLDPFLIVKNNMDRILDFDDDGGGKLNAKLTFTPIKDGTYQIHAAVIRGTGPFTLKINAAKAGKALVVGKDGVTVKGALKDEALRVSYHVKMEAGKSYKIDLKSKDFDAYLYLYDADGKKLAENDDVADKDTNSRIVHKAANDGVYVITATSVRMMMGIMETGEFVLEVREGE